MIGGKEPAVLHQGHVRRDHRPASSPRGNCRSRSSPPEELRSKFDFDPLDATKVWPESIVPFRPVGKMTLNRCPDNFFQETEQVAFNTGAYVPGIEPSEDKLLQGRNFSYSDTQRHRLGPNYQQLPDQPAGGHRPQRQPGRPRQPRPHQGRHQLLPERPRAPTARRRPAVQGPGTPFLGNRAPREPTATRRTSPRPATASGGCPRPTATT